MNLVKLNITSPEGSLFKGRVCSISLRGVEGDLAIMADHIPFVTPVKPCEIRIENEDGSTVRGKIDGGLLTVSENDATLLTGAMEIL